MSETTTTMTITTPAPEYITIHSKPLSAPKKLPIDISKYDILDQKQAGHIRHFHNLASQPPGEWAFMGSADPAQEWLDAYRYQLATMAYSASLAHYHRLPALRSPFKTLLRQLIDKMLRREVWGYWYLTSQSGVMVNPDIKELRKPWADPVVRENIMYSGHLLLMTTLYAMLFDDDKYEEEGALTFLYNPVFYGMGPETFSYTRSTLQDAVMKEMERNGWLGVCCEPNSIFIVCNQFPIIAIRYNDVRKGTNEVEGLLKNYQAAWEKKNSMFGKDGFLMDIYMTQQQYKYSSGSLGFTAWAGAMINSWNPKQAHETYKPQTQGFLTRKEDGRINLNPPTIAHAIRRLAAADKTVDPTADETAQLAWTEIRSAPTKKSMLPYHNPTFGYVIEYTSEVAEDPSILQGLLKHADTYLTPSWNNGGLYYKRCEVLVDEDGNHTQVDPFTGNAAIGYSRLNVVDGQRKMWEKPWTSEKVQSEPFVDGVGFGDGVDFLRAVWDEQAGAFILSVTSWSGESIQIEPRISNLPKGSYGIYVDGELTREVDITRGELQVPITVDESLKDIVILSLERQASVTLHAT